MARNPLPIDAVVPEVVAALGHRRAVVVEAPPGTGKTTRIPPALLAAVSSDQTIVVLEPRRLAARLSAVRVAQERGSAVGNEVGYQVRFDEQRSAATRVLYVTEGIWQARLASSGLRAFDGVGALVFDEFHERHLASDLLLGAARGRVPLVVMSATLDGPALASYLDAPIVRATAPTFPVAVEYLPRPSDRALELEVAEAVRQICLADATGDVLVFLPGAAEIARCRAQLTPRADGLGFEVAVLHGEMAPAEQDRTLAPGPRRKVILSTNVAETSLTLPRVTAVVDSGLHRQASHSPWSGLPELRLAPVCRASATQRAGRAGRVGPGRCLRLYTRVDHDARPAHDLPEVARADLTEAVLLQRTLAQPFDWLDAPPPAALAAATQLLHRLGALDGDAVTPLGRTLVGWPLHPRLGRVLYEAGRRGVGREAAGVVALLSERSTQNPLQPAQVSGPSDPLHELDLVGRHDTIRRAARQLEALVPRAAASKGGAAVDEALQRSLLCGYPDRVARRRQKRGGELVVAGGLIAELSPASVVRAADVEWMVAIDIVDRGPRGQSGKPMVRRASAVSPEWLLDLDVSEEVVLRLSPSGRVERVARIVYDGLVVDESTSSTLQPADTDEAVRLLFEAAHAGGRAARVSPEAVAALDARVRFAARYAPQLAGCSAQQLLDERLRTVLRDAVSLGQASLSALDDRDLVAELAADPALSAELDAWAPTHVPLPSGRRAAVQYDASAGGAEPFVAARLQDFFGQLDGPRIARGQVAVVLHLLGPNQRPLQVTRDLASFWDRTYPELRRQLSRRYPRHAWPEDPRHAEPVTGPTRRR